METAENPRARSAKWLRALARRVSNIDDIEWIYKQGRDQCVCVTFVNPHTVFLAERYPEYVQALDAMDHILPDGTLMVAYCRYVENRNIRRQSFDGNSLGENVLRFCGHRGIELFLVGGREGVADAAAAVYSKAYGVRVSGVRNGYFKSNLEMEEFCQSLVGFHGVIVVGMGAPHQERFLQMLKQRGWKGVAFSCGGYLDQAANRGARYYPGWVNRLNLRFAYRLFKEPRKLGRRYVVEYWPFYRIVAAELMGKLA